MQIKSYFIFPAFFMLTRIIPYSTEMSAIPTQINSLKMKIRETELDFRLYADDSYIEYDMR